MKYFLTLFVIIALTIPALGNDFSKTNGFKVSGFIKGEKTGEPVAGAAVFVFRDTVISGVYYRVVTTNKFGFYSVPELPEGIYYFSVKALGYDTGLEKIVLRDSSHLNIVLNISLTRKDVQLKEVVISENEEDEVRQPGMDRISKRKVESLPSASGEREVLRALETMPGVTQANEISRGLYVRGGSPDQTLTLLDGVPLYNPAHLGNFISTFNTEALQDIRLIKGAFPAEFGGRLGSVLDLRMRAGSKEKFSGKLVAGLINSSVHLEGPFGEESTFILSGRGFYYDLIQKSADKNSLVPRYNFWDLNSKITYNASSSQVISFNGFYTRDKLYNGPGNKDSNFDINWENLVLNGNWMRISTRSNLFTTSFSFIRYKFYSRINDLKSTVSASDHYSNTILSDLIFRSDVEFHPLENHKAKAGFMMSYHLYELIYSNQYNYYLANDPSSRIEINSLEAVAFMQDNWKAADNLMIEGGLRFSYFKDSKFIGIDPRFSFSWFPGGGFSINGAAGSSSQFMHLMVRNDMSLPTDIWYPSNENIEPGRAWQVSLGADKKFKDIPYYFSLAGYYKKMDNLYEYKDAPGGIDEILDQDLFTSGQGEAWGAEVFLEKRSGLFTGWIGYTLSWTRRKFELLNNGEEFYPKYDRRHDFSLVLSMKPLEYLAVSVSWKYASGAGITMPIGQYSMANPGITDEYETRFDFSERNGYHLPDYHRLDLNISWNPVNEPYQIFLNIYNLYNRKNPFVRYMSLRETDNVPVLKDMNLFPFMPTIGVRYEF